MNCERFRSNIAAFLAGELDERSSDEHRRHAEECSNCAAELKATALLVGTLRAHPERDVPECAEARVLEGLERRRGPRQQTTSRASLRLRIKEAFTMRRTLFGFGVLVVLAAVGIGVWPRQRGNTALAQVARAMENVKSAHIVMFRFDPDTRERHLADIWIKAPSKYRMRDRFGEEADDGKRSVRIATCNGVTTATIGPSKGRSDLEQSIPPLSFFNGEEAVRRFLADGVFGVVDERPTELPDGGKGKTIVLESRSGYKVLLTIDDATGRLARLERYQHDSLDDGIERVDYDMDLPDSMFEPQIPKNALVLDTLTPASPNLKTKRRAIGRRLEALGADHTCTMDGSCKFGSGYHSGIRFITEGKTDIYYLPQSNTYYVLGKALVTDSKRPGFKLVVEDGEFSASYKPDIPQWKVMIRIDKVGDFRAIPEDYWRITRIQNIGNGSLTITKHKATGDLTIQGKAKLLPLGVVYQNQVIEEKDLDLPDRTLEPEKMDFGSLPPSEIKIMKANIDDHNRYQRRESVRGKLMAAGAKGLSSFGRGNWGSCGSYHPGLRFESVPEDGFTLYYFPERNVYRVLGTARVRYDNFRHGFVKVAKDSEFEAPCPPD